MEFAKPAFFNYLNQEDQEEYCLLQQTFHTNRQKRAIDLKFGVMLEKIYKYVHKNNGKEIIRSLVVGIIWHSDYSLLVNNQQLSIMTNLQKSTLNMRFDCLKYKAVKCDTREYLEPFIRDLIKLDYSVSRHWCFRKKESIFLIPNLVQVQLNENSPTLQDDYEEDSIYCEIEL